MCSSSPLPSFEIPKGIGWLCDPLESKSRCCCWSALDGGSSCHHRNAHPDSHILVSCSTLPLCYANYWRCTRTKYARSHMRLRKWAWIDDVVCLENWTSYLTSPSRLLHHRFSWTRRMILLSLPIIIALTAYIPSLSLNKLLFWPEAFVSMMIQCVGDIRWFALYGTECLLLFRLPWCLLDIPGQINLDNHPFSNIAGIPWWRMRDLF